MKTTERMKLGNSIEEKAYKMFMKSFMSGGDDRFSIVRNIRIDSARYIVDLAILSKRKLIGVVEIKSDLQRYKHTAFLEFIVLKSVAEKNRAYFAIITDTKEFICWDTDSKKDAVFQTINDVYNHIIDILEGKESKIKHISELMYDTIQNNNTLNNIMLEANITDAEKLVAHLEYDVSIDQVMLEESLENKYFTAMLPELNKGTYIYRYVSFAYLFEMLKENKFSLNSIVSMNDKTEIDYMDKYIQGFNINDIIIDKSKVQNANESFISCFSSKDDDLTMWRLYTNNGNGVCLEYSIKDKQNRIDSYIKKVNYAVRNSNSEEIDEHEHIDVFRRLVILLKDKLKTDFRIRSLDIWKHFFKPSAFSDEFEIRLLMFNKKNRFHKKWRIDNSSGIVTSFIEFKLLMIIYQFA